MPLANSHQQGYHSCRNTDFRLAVYNTDSDWTHFEAYIAPRHFLVGIDILRRQKDCRLCKSSVTLSMSLVCPLVAAAHFDC